MTLEEIVIETELVPRENQILYSRDLDRLFPTQIIIYTTEKNDLTIYEQDAIDKLNNKKMFSGHFYIRKSGEIYRGRKLNQVGEFAYTKSNISLNQGCNIGICLEGDFNTDFLLYKQQKALEILITLLKQRYGFIRKITFLNEIDGGNNPGALFPFNELLKNLIDGYNGNSINLGNAQYTEFGSRELRYNPSYLMSGTDVYTMSVILFKLGFLAKGNITFYFDYNIRQALIQYQLENNLNPSGMATEATLDKLKISISKIYSENIYDRIIEYNPLDELLYGKDIDLVQERLNFKNYKCTKTGVFDEETKNAVIKFQKDNFIGDETGKIGPITWKLLTEILTGEFRELYVASPYLKGSDVESVQKKLNELGYNCPITSEYDDITAIQVKLYQLKNGFLPTGIVTKELFDRLFN